MAVRRESVRLDLDDHFTSGMARATAATGIFKKSLNDLDGTNVRTNRGLSETAVNTDRVSAAMRDGGAEIDRYSGRLRLILDGIAVLGPGLVPIAAVGVPAVTGLATALAAAGTAGAGALVAMAGVGDAVKAVEKARLEPTVANLQAAQMAMEKLGPDAQEFVRAFQDLRPVLGDIRDAAAEGLFPGLIDSLDSFEELAPKIARILREVNEASGEALANGVESLTTERWRPFFNFLAREMPAAVTSLAHIVGDLAHGAAEMWMAFDPGNDAFLGWLEDVASGFDKWASSAEATQGIEEFLAYVSETGPQVADLFGSLVNLLVQVGQAAAPIGGPVLESLTAVADALAAIADSDAGTEILLAAAAMSVLSRATAGYDKLAKTTWAQNLTGANGFTNTLATMRQTAIRGAAGIGLLATSMTDLDEKAGLANTTTGGLLGTMLKGGKGGAIGAAIGLTLDLASAMGDMNKAVTLANDALESGSPDKMRTALEALNVQLESFDIEKNGGLAGFWESFNPANWPENIGTIVDKVWGDDSQGQMVQLRAQLESDIAFFQSRLRGFGQAGDGLATALGRPLGEIDRSFEIATMSAAEFSAEIERLNGVLSDRASMRDYEAAIDAVTASLKENGKTLDEETPKGRANQEVLDNIAGSALKVAENMKAAQRVNFLRGARDDFVQAAVSFGMTQKAAKALADELGLLGKTKVKPPTVDVNDGPAKNRLKNLEAVFKALFGRSWRAVLDANDRPGVSKAKNIQRLLNDIFGKDWKALLDGDPSGVRDAVAQARSWLDGINGKTATTYIDTVRRNFGSSPMGDSGNPYKDSAEGNIFYAYANGGVDTYNRHQPEFAGPGPTRVWREPETGGESYIPHANDYRRPRAKSILEQTAAMFGGDVQWYAQGGMSGIGQPTSLGPESGLAQLLAEIRDLKNRLDADGKRKLDDHDRKIAELQLKILERQAEVTQLLHDFSLDSILPGSDKPQTLASQAQAELKDLKASIIDAGGHWTKQLERMSKALVASVSKLDREIRARDKLQKSLDTEQKTLDDLAETMKSFAQSVTANFQPSLFNQGSGLTGSFSGSGGSSGGSGGAAAGTVPLDPALAAALADLAALQANSDGSVATAAEASKLIAKIAELRAAQEAAQKKADEIAEKYKSAAEVQNAATEQSVSGLQSLTQTLIANKAAADAFAAALATLAANGLDGGLFQQLALSGDLGTAQELTALSPAEIEQLELLFNASQKAANEVGLQAMQTAFGPQFDKQNAVVEALTAQLATQEATITQLSNHIKNMDDKVENGATAGIKKIKPELDEITSAVAALPGQLAVIIGNHKP